MAKITNKPIVEQLATKKQQLVNSAVSDKERAALIEEQVAALRISAQLSEKQAAAVDAAQAILTEAGVTF